MVSINFSHFVLGIMILQLAVKACDANVHRGFQKVAAEDGNGFILPGRKKMHSAKEIYNGACSSVAVAGGRKMMVDRRELSNEVKKEESEKKKEEASLISGASYVGNTSKHTWKGQLIKMQSKLSSTTSTVNHDHDLKFNMGGFMALNADYHMAKTHPPKNN